MKCRVWIMAGLMVSGLTGLVMAQAPSPSHDDSFTKEGLFKADVATLKDTLLVAHPDVPLNPTKNVLWCGTLQLAWNKAIDLVGEKLQFTTPSPTADLLNRQNFTDADLDAASYVAIADFEKNNVEDEIRATLEKTFHGAASPELIPEKPANPGPSDFVAYAYLYKALTLAHSFKVLDPLNFGSRQVETFGFYPGTTDHDILDQVSLSDYKSEDDFIIKLKTKATDDELILAKVAPSTTLEHTVSGVLERIGKNTQENSWHPHGIDLLAIPKLNFDLRRNFIELEGLDLDPSPKAHIHPDPPLYIKKAQQLVRFQLNENGALLKSEAMMYLAMAGGGGGRLKPVIMVFDKPFLIMMKRASSKRPYFACWIGNSSLLIPSVQDLSQTSPFNQKYADAYAESGNADRDNGNSFSRAYEGFAASSGKNAIASFNKALQIDPDSTEAYNGLAWLMATYSEASLRNGKKAVNFATKACELSQWQNPNFVDTLAAAYAEAGDFDSAIKWENKCLEYTNLSPGIAEEAQTHMALFKSHKPFRD